MVLLSFTMSFLLTEWSAGSCDSVSEPSSTPLRIVCGRSVHDKCDTTRVRILRQWRLPSCLLWRVMTWHAVALRESPTSSIVPTAAKVSSPVTPQLRRELLLPCRWKTSPHTLRSIPRTFRSLLPCTQSRMSLRFPSQSVLTFSHRSSRSHILRSLSTERTFSTLTTPLKPPVLPIRTVSKNCAELYVRAGELVISVYSQWQEEPSFKSPLSPPCICPGQACGVALPQWWLPYSRSEYSRRRLRNRLGELCQKRPSKTAVQKKRISCQKQRHDLHFAGTHRGALRRKGSLVL